MSTPEEFVEPKELVAALQAQDLKKLDELLSRGKKLPDAVISPSGMETPTPLRMACSLGNLEMVKLLIEKGNAKIIGFGSSALNDIFNLEITDPNSDKRFENNRIIEYIQKQFFIQADQYFNVTNDPAAQDEMLQMGVTHAQFVADTISNILDSYCSLFKKWDPQYILKLIENLDKNTASILSDDGNSVSVGLDILLSNLTYALQTPDPRYPHFRSPYIDDQLRVLHDVGVQPRFLDNRSEELQTLFRSKFYTARAPEAPEAPFPGQRTKVSQSAPTTEPSQPVPDSKFSDESRQRAGSIAEAFSTAADRKREEETLSSEAPVAGQPLTAQPAAQERRKSISKSPEEELAPGAPEASESLKEKGPDSTKPRKI